MPNFARTILEKARSQAITMGVGIGEDFTFDFSDTPSDSANPYLLPVGLRMSAGLYGLTVIRIDNSTIHFRRNI